MKPKIKNGVLVPSDNCFESINSFIHNPGRSPEYEELQWALLGAAAEVDKLRNALETISRNALK